jgi:hypothetical protein
MSIIVKFCNKRNFLSLFTRINHNKHDTIFHLKTKEVSKESVYVGGNKYAFDNFGVFMRNSKQPTCKIIGYDVVALNNINPGTELTYDQAIHKEEQKEKEQREKNKDEEF